MKRNTSWKEAHAQRGRIQSTIQTILCDPKIFEDHAINCTDLKQNLRMKLREFFEFLTKHESGMIKNARLSLMHLKNLSRRKRAVPRNRKMRCMSQNRLIQLV